MGQEARVLPPLQKGRGWWEVIILEPASQGCFGEGRMS